MKMNLKTTLRVAVCLILLAVLLTACGPPKTLEASWTEAELQQEEALCNAVGLQIDLKPGKIICTGMLEGEDYELELVVDIVDGAGQARIVRFIVNGEAVSAEDIAEANAQVAEDNTFLPEEGYVISSIIITDDDLTVIETIK